MPYLTHNHAHSLFIFGLFSEQIQTHALPALAYMWEEGLLPVGIKIRFVDSQRIDRQAYLDNLPTQVQYTDHAYVYFDPQKPNSHPNLWKAIKDTGKNPLLLYWGIDPAEYLQAMLTSQPLEAWQHLDIGNLIEVETLHTRSWPQIYSLLNKGFTPHSNFVSTSFVHTQEIQALERLSEQDNRLADILQATTEKQIAIEVLRKRNGPQVSGLIFGAIYLLAKLCATSEYDDANFARRELLRSLSIKQISRAGGKLIIELDSSLPTLTKADLRIILGSTMTEERTVVDIQAEDSQPLSLLLPFSDIPQRTQLLQAAILDKKEQFLRVSEVNKTVELVEDIIQQISRV